MEFKKIHYLPRNIAQNFQKVWSGGAWSKKMKTDQPSRRVEPIKIRLIFHDALVGNMQCSRAHVFDRRDKKN